jgi:CubicO group peptidase (beta-lactamase class C family)
LADVVAGISNSPTGKGIIYANGAFSLLGHMAARFHGRPFNETVRERVLEPLGMERSSFKVEPLRPGVSPTAALKAPAEGRGSIRSWTGPQTPSSPAPELARFRRMVLRGGELDGSASSPRPSADRRFRLSTPELDRASDSVWVSRFVAAPSCDNGWPPLLV